MLKAWVRSAQGSVRFKINLAIASVFLVVMVALSVNLYVEQRTKNLQDAITHLIGTNNFYFDSLNTLMLADGMEEREELRLKMLELPGITEVRVNRAESITKKFGEGFESEKPVDEFDHRGLAGESVVEVREIDGNRVVTVVEPYLMTENTRGTNCLECHRGIESGTVSGAIRLSYSLEDADSQIPLFLAKKVGILLVMFVLALVALSVLMQRLVRNPIDKALGVANAIAGGDLSSAIDNASRDEMGQLMDALKTMQGNLRESIENDRRTAAESLRIKLALDSSVTPTTVSDADNRLIYMNQAAKDLFTDMETAWRTSNSEFVVAELLGKSLGELMPAGELQDVYRRKLERPTEMEGEIAERLLHLFAAPVYDSDNVYQGRVTQWEDLTEQRAQEAREQERLEQERREAAANQRVKVALDQVAANVMLADPDGNIIYLNRSAQSLFDAAADDLRLDLPNFDETSLVGTNIDVFHKNPEHQRGLLASLSDTYVAEMEVGGRTMRIVANPVTGEDGDRLGTAVEWEDRTEQVAVEREIDSLVEAARKGDLDQRIVLEGRSGFFRQLGEGFNQLMDELAGVFDDIARVMGYMAEGDLRHSIEQDYQGRFGRVKTDVNRTLENIRGIVANLTSVAEQVNGGATEISTGNSSLSSRTEDQASSIQETAASLEELTSTVRNNADNALLANKASASARDAAEQGGEVVARAVSAMHQIDEASAQIGEIIGVIDEIAFQTNLLALNASVEAARAGEQGRGFAVVATEVRNLASRSADAAKQIKELILDSSNKVKSGSELVNETGQALEEILLNVKKAADVVSEISAASHEQSAGIDQVNQAVNQIDESTQQNAALAEQASAASAALSENARELMRVVGNFRT